MKKLVKKLEICFIAASITLFAGTAATATTASAKTIAAADRVKGWVAHHPLHYKHNSKCCLNCLLTSTNQKGLRH